MTSRLLCFTLALPLLACSSSNFSVAGGDQDSGAATDTAQGGDDSSSTTDSGDGGVAVDSAFLDGLPDALPPIDAPALDGATCAGKLCGGACVDTNTDPDNCGACGAKVCHNERCVGGKPACVPNFISCPASGSSCLGCVDKSGDAQNCGFCAKKCTTEELCADGTCTLITTMDCPGTTKPCTPPVGSVGTSCYDFDKDPTACGGCGKQCAPDEFCNAGSCAKYASAPGCSTCPCPTCGGGTATCCTVYGATACASACGG